MNTFHDVVSYIIIIYNLYLEVRVVVHMILKGQKKHVHNRTHYYEQIEIILDIVVIKFKYIMCTPRIHCIM